MRIPCKKCLLAETGLSAEYENVKQFIEVLPEIHKVPQEVYEARLNICKECENLADGTCIKCGCYVEIRAIKNRMSCPDEKDRWSVPKF